MTPSRFTEPLSRNDDGLPAYSDGYALVDLAHKYVTTGGTPLRLDVWQQHLLIRILEKCPPEHTRAGQLRYASVVVSIPRQNGKSLLGALLSLYGLLQHRQSGARVLGLARGVEQARIVFGYTRDAVQGSSALSKLLRTTETRGITNIRNNGTYKVLTAKPEAVQGYLSTLAIVDELHVLIPEIWDAIVTSQKAQTNALIVGITTAGDDNSVLLKRLYAQGDAAVQGESETFGFFVWEAPEGAALTEESITIANPAVACGRISAAKTLENERHSPEPNWRRFTLNQFWSGQGEPWIATEDWYACNGTGVTEKKDLVYAIDATPGLGHASVTVSRKAGDVIESQLVASIVQPDLAQLERIAKRLRDENGRGPVVMDTYVLGDLAERLSRQGFEVVRFRGPENFKASGLAYSLIKRHKVRHNNDVLVNQQSRDASVRFSGESFRIVRAKGGKDIDSLMATVYGIYAAETYKKRGLGIAA